VYRLWSEASRRQNGVEVEVNEMKRTISYLLVLTLFLSSCGSSNKESSKCQKCNDIRECPECPIG